MFTSECEKTDSQMARKQTKKKPSEIPNALLQQSLAAQDHKNFKARKFTKEKVLIETIGGQPIAVDVWVSNEKPSVSRKKYEEVQDSYTCEICRKEFDERRKLLIHARCHKKKEISSAPDINTKNLDHIVVNNDKHEIISATQPNDSNKIDFEKTQADDPGQECEKTTNDANVNAITNDDVKSNEMNTQESRQINMFSDETN